MYQHFILIASSYAKGTRVGYHLVVEGELDSNNIQEKMKRLNKINRNDIGVHSFFTDSSDWQSVIEYDSFFEDIMVCQDFDEFEEVLQMDSKISAIDVAKFFLSVDSFSHLQIQKLVYLAYKTYLFKYNKSLFEEKIIAYQYGPVVEEVYQKFKRYGSENITIDDDTKYYLKDIRLPQSLGRMLLVENSYRIIGVLFETINKFGHLTGSQLVSLTHSKDSPWSKVYSKNTKAVITDKIILEYGKNEKLA